MDGPLDGVTVVIQDDDHWRQVLSEQRAQTIVNELVGRGIGKGDIIAVGRGSEAMLVKPDDTAAKKQKNRRYEVRVRL